MAVEVPLREAWLGRSRGRVGIFKIRLPAALLAGNAIPWPGLDRLTWGCASHQTSGLAKLSGHLV